MLALLAMSPSEAESLLQQHAESYAEDMSRIQDIPMDEARARVAAQRRGLLLHSGKELFYHLMDGKTPVGRLWLTRIDEAMLFISYIEILPEYRGKGFGRQALSLVETTGRRLGARQVWLHVFADNAVAKSLYREAGFRESGMQMFKNLG